MVLAPYALIGAAVIKPTLGYDNKKFDLQPFVSPMRFALSKSLLRLASIFVAALVVADASPIAAATPLRLTFDRPVDAIAAPFVLADSKGLFRTEGLQVTTDVARGSADAIARVASGDSDAAVADINALIRYRDREDAVAVKAVFVLLNTAPYAVIARRSRGIATFADLEGKTIGFAEDDPALRLWPALVKRTGLRADKIRLEKIAAAVREPMLSAGQIDALAGLSYQSAINLRDRGIPASDLAIFRYSDLGVEAYGHAVIVNPRFLASNPEAVKAFLRAVVAGARLTIKNPPQAVDEVMTRMDGGVRDIELERLRAAIRDHIVTDEVKRNGLGGIDEARFALSIEQIADDFKFRKRPLLSDIFDDTLLPASAARKVN